MAISTLQKTPDDHHPGPGFYHQPPQGAVLFLEGDPRTGQTKASSPDAADYYVLLLRIAHRQGLIRG